MKRRRKSRKKWAVWAAVLAVLAVVCILHFYGNSVADDGYGWNLMLVNASHPISSDYYVDLTTLSDGNQVDSRIYEDLQSMLDACRGAGLQPLVCSSYRTWEKQTALYQNKVDEFLAQGYSESDAEEEAEKIVAVPGASEHQTGLALDIVDGSYQALDEGQENTAVQQWLLTHCWEYGFILRYPSSKSEITGIIYEPWHYRYVGKEAARDITDQGLCLEEYIKTLNKRGIWQQFLQKLQSKTTDLDTASLDHGWNLILVNASHKIPSYYGPEELTTLSNGEQVDSRIYPDLQAMFDDARAAGLSLFVRAGYRTEEDQRRLLEEKIAAYEDEGYDTARAEELARDWVALPGTSEHQLGLAVDVNADNDYSTDEEVYGWLKEHSWRYGFVLRYPPDKTEITGISNEPWHFRYVGKDAAAEMHASGLCLEEYIETLD